MKKLYQQGAGRYASPPSESEGGVAYWSFDNDDGDRVVEDEWGNNDGVMGNSSESTQPSYTDGGIGKGLEFDGNDTYLGVGDHDSLDAGSEITISAWLYSKNQPGTSWQHAIDKWDGTTSPQTGFRVMENPQEEVEVQFRDSQNNNISLLSEKPLKESWNHISVALNGGKARLYLNGVLIDKNESLDLNPINNKAAFTIGSRAQNYFSHTKVWNGSIDEVKVFNKALSTQQIHELYQHGSEGRDMRQITRNQGLVGYWSLDEDSGQKAYDLSGNGNTGMLGSSNASDSSDPSQGVEGVLGTSAYDFDGDNDYINVSESSLPTGDQTFTIASWIKVPNTCDSNGGIFGYGNWATSGETNALRLHGGGCSGLKHYFWSNDLGVTDLDINDGQWHSVAVTYNGENRTIYLDGRRVASDIPGPVDMKAQDANIGVTNGGEYFEGSIDEVRIYNRSLTASEIQSLYSTSQRGEITTRNDFRDPTRAGIRGGIFSPDNGSLGLGITGSPDMQGFSERRNVSLNGESVFAFDWNKTHSVFDTSITFDNEDVTETAGTVGGFAVNISQYTEGFKHQFSDGVFSWTEADTGDEVKLGSGYQPGGSLVAYYNFNGEDRTVEDRSGNGNTGILSGSSIRFDGENDTINLSESSVFDQSLGFTINAWVKSEGGSGKNAIMWHGKNQSGTVTDNLAYSLYTENGDLKLQISDGSSSETAVANANLDAGRWHMVTGKLSSEALELYIDGELKDTDNREVSPQTGGETLIGSKGLESGDWYFKGHIDEPRFYNTSLSKFEIEDLYHGESVPGEDEGLVMHQSFREGPRVCQINASTRPNNCLKGETNNLINGTPQKFEENTYNETGSGWSHETGEAEQMTGKEGVKESKSYRFDGIDDQVRISGMHYSQKGQIDEITVCSWAKSRGMSEDRSGSFMASFDRSEYWRLSMNDDAAISNHTVGWDLTNSSSVTSDLNTPNNYSDGNWHHICGVYDSTGSEQKIIIDGEVKAKKNPASFGNIGTGVTRYGEVGGGSEAEFLQDFGTTGDANHEGAGFNGKIDDFRIYSQALPMSQIRQIYRPTSSRFTSSFFNAGQSINWQGFSWSEKIDSGEDIQGRVQTASEVKETSDYSEWNQGSSSYSGPTEGLVGYWRFEDTNPDDVRDWSGNGNNGTLNGGVDTYAEGFRPQSNAYNFDGEDDYIEVKDNPVQPTKNFTFSTWINPESGGTIYESGGSGDNKDFTWLDINKNRIQAGILDDSVSSNYGFYTKTNRNIIDGSSWHHITVRKYYNTTHSKFEIWLNGERRNTTIDTNPLDGQRDTNSSFYIGQRGYDQRYVDSKISNLRYYNRKLSTEETKSLYTSGSYTSDWIKASNVNWAQWKQVQKGTDLKPMAQWRFDSGEGQTAIDSVGNNDGTLGGSTSSESSDPAWTSEARYGEALEFDGSDDYVVDESSSELNLNGKQLTVSAWAKPESNGWSRVIMRSQHNHYQLDFSDNREWRFYAVDNNSTAKWQLSSPVDLGEWYHITGTLNEDELQLYVNGKPVGEPTEWTGNELARHTNEEIWIGRSDPDYGPNFFNGSIDNIMIYNQTLSSSEVNALYNAPSQSWASTSLQVRSRESDPEEDSLVASYNFEGVGQTVMDASGNGNSGTLGNNVTTSVGDPDRVSGYSGQAIEGDGLDKGASVKNFPEPNNFTVSTWVNFDRLPAGDQKTDIQNIVTHGHTAAPTYDDAYWTLMMDARGTNKIHFKPSGPSGEASDGITYRPDNFRTDKWYHVTGSWSPEEIKLYIDGDLVRTVSDPAQDDLYSDVSELIIGKGSAERYNFNRGINGTIDETKIYGDVLSTEEVQKLYRISDLSKAENEFTGSSLDINNSGQYYQFKLNSLTGASNAVPEVESVTLANTSGWTQWSPDNSVGLDLGRSQYIQAQFNLSSGDARDTPVLDSFGFGVPREPVSLNAAPAISNPRPDDRNVFYKDGELSVRVSDPDGQALSGSFVNASDGSVIESFSTSENGTVSTVWDGLARDEEYKWRVEVGDGVSFTQEVFNFSTYDVNLTWTDEASIESGFNIYSNVTGSYERIGQAPANSESFIASSAELYPGPRVCYRVHAYNSAGESPPAETCFDTSRLTG